jgi:hypothetical protein
MHLTMKVVNVVDKLHLNDLFKEVQGEVILNLVKFNPKKVEKLIDTVLKSNGKNYEQNELEKKVLKELDF